MNESSDLEKNLELVAKTSLFVLVSLFLGKILSYVYRIIIGRYYGPEVYGIFVLAASILGWFVVLSTVGLTGGLSRYISFYRGSDDKKSIKTIVRATISIFFVSSLILGLFLFLAAEQIAVGIFHNTGLIVFLKFFGLAVPLTVFMNCFLSILQAFEKPFWYSFILNLLLNLIKVSLLVSLIIWGFGENSVIFSHLVSVMVCLLFSYYLCKKSFGWIFQKETANERGVFKEVFSYSWPLVLFGVVEGIFYWVDTFMIGYFENVSAVGLYNSAVPIALLFTLTSDIFMQVFFPIVTKEFSRKRVDLIRDLSKQVSKWILVINLPILVLVLFFPGAFINLLFGNQYLEASASLRWLAIGYFFISLFTISSKLISMAGKSKLILLDIIIATVTNILLNLLFIPRYGLEGAAVATMLSLILLSAIFLFQAKIALNIIPLKLGMIKVILVSTVPVVALLFIRKNLPSINLPIMLIILVLFGTFYLAILIFAGCLDKNDLVVLESIKRKLFKINTKRPHSQ